MKPELTLEFLVNQANKSRHIETTALHVAGLIAAREVDFIAALWPDSSGTAIWVIKGVDLIERVRPGKPFRLSPCSFWLPNEDRADGIVKEIKALTWKATTSRGEFESMGTDPDGDEVVVEFVPNGTSAEVMYLVKGGLRIARRGEPGTREQRPWIPIVPHYPIPDTANRGLTTPHLT